MPINVITGAPSSGKSSLIRELSKRGYRTTPEAATLVIDHAVSNGDDPQKLRQSEQFQFEVNEMDREIESNVDFDTDEHVYMDRGLADNIAYRRHYGIDVPRSLVDATRSRYDTIFYCARLPFEDDYTRDEDDEEAQEVGKRIKATYESLGYEVLTVPVMPIDERADYIERLSEPPVAIH